MSPDPTFVTSYKSGDALLDPTTVNNHHYSVIRDSFQPIPQCSSLSSLPVSVYNMTVNEHYEGALTSSLGQDSSRGTDKSEESNEYSSLKSGKGKASPIMTQNDGYNILRQNKPVATPEAYSTLYTQNVDTSDSLSTTEPYSTLYTDITDSTTLETGPYNALNHAKAKVDASIDRPPRYEKTTIPPAGATKPQVDQPTIFDDPNYSLATNATTFKSQRKP